MNAKLSKHGFWHCHENGLIKTIQTIPHNLFVSFPVLWGCVIRINQDNLKSTAKGSRLETHIWVVGYRLKRLDEPIFMAGPKPMRTEFGIRQRLESCGYNSGKQNSEMS